MDNDAEVVQRVLDGERDAFEILVLRYGDAVFGVVARRVPPDAAQSVAQEVFVSAFRSLGSYEPGPAFEPWLLRIARRRCCDYWRQRQRQREIPATAVSPEQVLLLEAVSHVRSQEEFDRQCEREEARELVWLALGQLKAEDRLLVECMYFDQLPVAEVAATLDWSLAKVKVRAFRARRKLKRIIEGLSPTT
jgi:RNA polymerase sigma-70 factor (ECF subfamily)